MWRRRPAAPGSDSQAPPSGQGLRHTQTSARATEGEALVQRIMNFKMQITPAIRSRTLFYHPLAPKSWKFKVGVDFRDFEVQTLRGACEKTQD